jgi:hypothetical protein
MVQGSGYLMSTKGAGFFTPKNIIYFSPVFKKSLKLIVIKTLKNGQL